MELTNRTVRIRYVPGHGLLAADVSGRVHLLDDDLRLLRSSPVVPGGQPIYSVAAAGDWVVGKDIAGNIARWSLSTLELTDYLDARTTCDPSALLDGEEPSRFVNRGIGVWRDRVYVVNGYVQLVILDLATFTIESIGPSITGDVPIEWICTEHPSVHAVTDKKGRLFLGSLDTLDFPTMVHIDNGANLHRVRYDRRHDRFWVTQDSGDGEYEDVANGVVIVRPDGTVVDRLRFALDDVETLEFGADHETVYVGGFDGILHLFDNTGPQLRIAREYTDFTHQINDMTLSADRLYVLCQDGVITARNLDGSATDVRAPFRRHGVWDIQRSLEDERTLYCATDDGVAVVETVDQPQGGPLLQIAAQHRTGFGFTRRVGALPGGWAGITRDRRVFRADRDGAIRWVRDLPTLPHTLAVAPDHARLLVATNGGGLELAAGTGEVLAELDVEGLPLWVSAYLPGGERLLGTRNGRIVAFAADAPDELWRYEIGEYPKRMWVDRGRLVVTGEGGARTIALDGSALLGRWNDLISNTCENAAFVDGMVWVVSYTHQLLGYDEETAELVDLLEDLPDIPKAMLALDGGYLVVGGRGGFLTTYRVGKNGVTRVRDRFLAR